MAFVVYDLILLALFVLFVSFFLYLRRDNLKREGLLFLYRTSLGIKLINKVGEKYQKTLKVMSYLSVILGYFLMAGMLYLFGKIVWIYAFDTALVNAINIPPIVPLVPYIDKIVDVGLPPFYFTYWIIIIAIIAITHEFSHGIFAVYNKVKVKTTGFGFFPFFLPVFLAAFVELDEKKMPKKSKFSQLAILSAGTFANILTAIFFFVVMILFFSLAFAPAGIVYDSYSYSIVPVAGITMINNVSLSNPTISEITPLIKNASLNDIFVGETKYIGIREFSGDGSRVALYDDAPAVNSELNPIILEINGEKVTSIESFREEILKYSPGETVTLKTKGENIEEIDVVLGEDPRDESLPFLGIAFLSGSSGKVTGKLISELSAFKSPHVYYEPKFDGVSMFIYNLLWWLFIISISVALVNMLPMGIFDGGRFFYLTVLAITKNEKIAKKAFSFMSFLLFFLILLVVFFWIFQSYF